MKVQRNVGMVLSERLRVEIDFKADPKEMAGVNLRMMEKKFLITLIHMSEKKVAKCEASLNCEAESEKHISSESG